MKKFILPVILVVSFLFFLPQKVDAQKRQECDKTRARASYNCLTGRTKCVYSCTKDVSACYKTCSQSNDACEKQVEVDYQACLGAIKKDSKNPPKTEASPEVKTSTDCHETFNKESNSCLKESTKCIDSCVDKANEVMSLTVDGGKVNLECQRNVCDPSSEACNNKATANFKACLAVGKQPAASETKQETPKQEGLPVFIGEWFSRFSQATDGLIALPGAFADVVYEDKFYLAGDFPKLSEMSLEDFYQGNWYPNDDTPDRSPNITDKDEQKAWEVFLPIYIPDAENITVVKGQGQLKMPDSNDFVPITSTSGGDTLQVTYLDSIVRSTSDTVQMGQSWAPDSGAVINIPQGAEIKFLKPVQDEKTQEIKRMLKLNKGELEVKVKNAKIKNKFGVQGDFFDLFVIQTHFWVNQSQDKKMAVIGVYEGEVEVKTNDGKVVKVKPDGDKPGVVVVTQKLSVARLTVMGLILVIVVGGILWLVKQKSTLRPSKKR